MKRFLMSLGDENFKFTCSEAKSRGISVQQLIRAVIIPEWVAKRKPIDVSPLLSSRELSASLSRLSVSSLARTRQ